MQRRDEINLLTRLNFWNAARTLGRLAEEGKVKSRVVQVRCISSARKLRACVAGKSKKFEAAEAS